MSRTRARGCGGGLLLAAFFLMGPMPVDRDELRDIVATLATIDRPSASAGEEAAAHWIAERLRSHGCDVRIEEERAYTGYARSLAGQCAVGAIGAGVAAAGARHPVLRRAGGALAALAAAGIAEDVSNGPQVFRRLAMRRRPAWNVVAETGDREARTTLLVLAHHDAASSGLVFDQTAHRAFAERFPQVIDRIDTAFPLWWPVIAGPLVGAAGALIRRRRLAAAGAGLAVAATAVFVDIERSPTVPGANDNLSAVAALVALARAIEARPVSGLRVLLVSCGAEESLQGGIRAFAARHFDGFPRDGTSVLNLDSVGSPRLVMLEGEGPFRMEDYAHPEFRDRVARVAERAGITLRRGMRSRASTDSVICSRAGFATATIVSIDRAKAIPNYHLMTDTPENVDYETVAAATQVAEVLVRDLAGAAAS